MAGFETPTNGNLIRSQLWSAQLKEALLDDLLSMKFTKIINSYEEAVLSPMLDGMLALANPVSIPTAIAMGAAAAIIKNPAVTRRFWAGMAE